MPSLATRMRYQGIVLERAEAALSEAAEAVGNATETLEAIEAGTLDMDAITVGGVRFIHSFGDLIPEP